MTDPEAAPKKDEVEEASEESFPASDPPSFTPLHAGTPDPEKEPVLKPGTISAPNENHPDNGNA